MIDLEQYEIWFVTGSQHLYGQKTLEQVAEHSREIAEALGASAEMPVNVVFKPVMTTPEIVATWVVRLAASHLTLGVAFAVAFAWRGIAHIDPHARGASLGFRLLVTPGVIVLWPLLAWRWASGRTEPPAERNAHRSAARALSRRDPAGAGR